jgi:hypothetical protein
MRILETRCDSYTPEYSVNLKIKASDSILVLDSRGSMLVSEIYLSYLKSLIIFEVICSRYSPIPPQASAERVGHSNAVGVYQFPLRHLQNVLDRVFPKRAELAEMFRTGRFPDPNAPSFIQRLKTVTQDGPAAAAAAGNVPAEAAAAPAGKVPAEAATSIPADAAAAEKAASNAGVPVAGSAGEPSTLKLSNKSATSR